MAQRRMFSKDVSGSDAFLEMPVSSQLLYFHLGMEADDDGFVGSPKKVSRMIGCGEDDLKVLASKRFILVFPSGVVVIKHWKINNYIQSDRYKETRYLEEKKALITKENGSYTECIQNLNKMETQVRLGKVRLDKDCEIKSHDSPVKKKGNPEIKEAIMYFIAECEKIKKFKPAVNWGADGKILKTTLPEIPLPEVKELFTYFLKSKKCDELGCTIRIALTPHTINLWRQSKTKKVVW